MELDWENLLDDWDGEDCWRNWVQENCSRPKRNSGDFSNRDCMSASKDYVAALSRVHVFRRYLMSLENGTLFKNIVQCLTI